MIAAHTPAPMWTRCKASGSYWPNAICEGPSIIATVLGDGYPLGEGWGPKAEATACLTTAAPDLLAAAQRMAAQLEGGNDFEEWEAAKAELLAAIAKATGKETNA